MSEEIKKSTKFTIGCMSWTGVLLSIAIIAIRAFQPNAIPIESWSVSSWILMLLPVIFPLIFWIGFFIIGLFCVVIAALFSK